MSFNAIHEYKILATVCKHTYTYNYSTLIILFRRTYHFDSFFEFRVAVSVQWLLFFMVGSQMFFIWILCTEKCPTSLPQLCLKQK